MSSRKRRHTCTRATFADLLHPNFEELAREYPDFAKAWNIVRQQQRERGGSLSSNVTQDFSIATTRALMHTYFSLSLPQIPTLCPPIPNRYFFVRWINQQLLPLSEKEDYFEPSTIYNNIDPQRTRFGIDLGTGATCIYPLLFCAQSVNIEDHDESCRRGDWKWLASEINPQSVEMAIQNVKTNDLESKIQVIQVSPTHAQTKADQTDSDDNDMVVDKDDSEGSLPTLIDAGPLRRLLESLPQESRPTGFIDIIMTNPPFHDPNSPNVTNSTRAGDSRHRTTLTNDEASYPGGEVNFVIDMVVDSLYLMPHPRDDQKEGQPSMTALWYASMFGKKASWVQLSKILTYMLGPARVQSTEFGPGNLTRWFLGWTFMLPNVRSPLAAYSHRKGPASQSNNPSNKATGNAALLTFDVMLEDKNEIARGVIAEVVDRTMTYFRAYPGCSLTATLLKKETSNPIVTVREETPRVLEWESDHLSPSIVQALQKRNISFMDFLPRDGHFVVDVSFIARGPVVATVNVHAYAHSSYGRKLVDKMTSHLQSDICRTSRRWRRLLQRQQNETHQDQQQQPMET